MAEDKRVLPEAARRVLDIPSTRRTESIGDAQGKKLIVGREICLTGEISACDSPAHSSSSSGGGVFGVGERNEPSAGVAAPEPSAATAASPPTTTASGAGAASSAVPGAGVR